jgi:hypothetical protein
MYPITASVSQHHDHQHCYKVSSDEAGTASRHHSITITNTASIPSLRRVRHHTITVSSRSPTASIPVTRPASRHHGITITNTASILSDEAGIRTMFPASAIINTVDL